MKFESGVCLAILVVFGLFTESECGRRHRHRHRHHLTTTEENSETEVVSTTENQFVAAFRSNQSDSEESTATPNNLQSRLASLEQYVRYLCLEDEEDVDRRIRHLGIKCICPKTEAPVCGSDDVTYYNRCFLQCRAQQALLSYHRYRITLKKFGAC
ncbi:Leech-derived tryptase inhibitor C [Orchesella cincta]|uniref:Leech-derived tryptase inhibitor C n=1 Tax=Orchesella cincta TaxID=48709 RepID=A0A1D2N0X9_ORCCI|nr:Leech-derived tryptase inhibitor C [Orchesella cincta]